MILIGIILGIVATYIQSTTINEILSELENKVPNISFINNELSLKEKHDIQTLESIKSELSNPRILSVLIWQTYYRDKVTQLCNDILGTKQICGIYKITNQKSKECYIGQSVNVQDRWKTHCKCGLGIDTPIGNQLYKSMQEDGLYNFTFELLTECSKAELNEKIDGLNVDEKIATLNGKIGTVDSKIDAEVQARETAIQGVIESVNERVGAVEVSVSSLSEEVSTLGSLVETQSGAIIALADQKQDKLTPGANINIQLDSEGNTVISASGGLAEVNWGGITGDINNQADLQQLVNNKVVGKVDKTQTIAGLALSGNISKEALLTELNVEDGAEVNKIDDVGDNFSIDENKILQLEEVEMDKVAGLEDALDSKVVKETDKFLMSKEQSDKLDKSSRDKISNAKKSFKDCSAF